MKKKLKTINNVSTMILVFLLAVGIGALSRNVIQPKQVVEIKSDALPLKNGGAVHIQMVAGKKVVFITYEDLKYISKKVKVKKLIKSLDGLFARMVE